MDEQNPQNPNHRSGDEHDDQYRAEDTGPVFGQPTPSEDNTTRPLPPYAPAPQQSWFDQYGQTQTTPTTTQTATRTNVPPDDTSMTKCSA